MNSKKPGKVMTFLIGIAARILDRYWSEELEEIQNAREMALVKGRKDRRVQVEEPQPDLSWLDYIP